MERNNNSTNQDEGDEKLIKNKEEESKIIRTEDGGGGGGKNKDAEILVEEKNDTFCSIRKCIGSICCLCCIQKSKNKGKVTDDDNRSLNSQEINDFIEEEIRKMSEETIKLES